ncbi:hypothetical protein FHX12_005709 [Rhizobium sp. BK609]|nr:hypothetical protein [Rhizobium sp. BK098]MBB3618687.1 hypothetical protein [Rhizobium sp. BK609]MBB3684395.1 hypothetical protein [Rhizobium sp. BK612]
MPWIKDATGSTIASMFFLAACLVIAVLLVLVIGRIVPRIPRPEDLGNSGAARVK